MRTPIKSDRIVFLPSPYAAGKEFNAARKAVGDSCKQWSHLQCIEVALALGDQLRFRDVLLSRAAEKHRRVVSVSAAARSLKMHRASVHRYLQGKPHLRTARGKVILGRLIEEMRRDSDGLETRGRRSAMRPRRPKLNNLPDHLAPFSQCLAEFWAWRRELGRAWLRWSPEDCLDVAECFAPAAEFVGKLNQRALRLMQAAAA